jgi:hypothetical protein
MRDSFDAMVSPAAPAPAMTMRAGVRRGWARVAPVSGAKTPAAAATRSRSRRPVEERADPGMVFPPLTFICSKKEDYVKAPSRG